MRKGWGSWHCVIWRREGSRVNPIHAYKYVKGECKDDGARLFSAVLSHRIFSMILWYIVLLAASGWGAQNGYKVVVYSTLYLQRLFWMKAFLHNLKNVNTTLKRKKYFLFNVYMFIIRMMEKKKKMEKWGVLHSLVVASHSWSFIQMVQGVRV